MPHLDPVEWLVITSAIIMLVVSRNVLTFLWSLIAGIGTLILAGEARAAFFLSPVAAYWFVGFSVAGANIAVLVLRSSLAVRAKIAFLAVMTTLFFGVNLGSALFRDDSREVPAGDTDGSSLYAPDFANPPFVMPPPRRIPRPGDIQLMEA